MRTRWLSCGLLVLVVSAAQARDRLVVDAFLDAEANTVSGCATFRIEDRGVDLSELRFQLYPNINCADNSACGIRVDSLFVDGADMSPDVIVDGTDAYFPLDPSVPPGQSLQAQVWFTTHIPANDSRLGLAYGQYTLTAWFPQLAPWREDRWQGPIYRDFLEPAADLLDIEAIVAYPDSLDLIAPGIVEIDAAEGLATAHISMPTASGVPLFFATGFNLDSTAVLDASLKLYYRESDRFIVDSVRTAAAAALEYMSDYVFKYPFDELVLVIGGLSRGGGLEQPRMILGSSPPRASSTRLYTAMIVHEVVHQWFYGVVNSDQAEAPWLDEAVTEYLGLKIGSYRAQGKPDLLNVFGLTVNHLSLNRMSARAVMETDAMTRRGDSFYDRAVYFGAIYNKGTLILKTLGALMGEEGERQFWREYADSFKYAVPEPDDFVRIANKYLPPSATSDARTILDHTAATDFVVVSLSTEQTATAQDTARGEPVDTLVWRASIEYLAQHPLGFPVDFHVEFHDGSVIDTVLNPEPGLHKIEYTAASPAVAAIIDPEYKYALDIDYLNNSLVRERSRGASLRLFSGVTFLVESLLSSLWGW